MKTIKIESSFWVGDIVYGIVAKYNKQDKLECSIEKFVIKEVITTPENGPVKMYTIENVDSGRKFRCADDEVTDNYDEVEKQYSEDSGFFCETQQLGLNGRNLCCSDQVLCSYFVNPMNLVHEVEISSETAGVLIDNDGVKECMLVVMDGHELIREYKKIREK